MLKKGLLLLLVLILCVGVGCTKQEGYKLKKKVVAGEGQIEVIPDKKVYNLDQKVTVRARAETGYQFLEWTHGLSGSEEEKTIIISKDTTLGAKFTPLSSKIKIKEIGKGSVKITPENFDYGDQLNLTATPDTNSNQIWQFERWRGDISGTENPKYITLGKEMNIKAEFVRYYKQNIEVSGSGSITVEPDKEQYKEGTVIQLTANPETGFTFVGWSGDVGGKQQAKEIIVTDTNEADKIKIKAAFAKQNKEGLTITTNITGSGRIELNPDQQKYEEGEQVEIRATAGNDFSFVSWDGDLTGAKNPMIITVSKDMNIKAKFEQQLEEQFTITSEVEGRGQITLMPEKDYYAQGEEVTITAEGVSEYDFYQWIGEEFGGSAKASKTITINKDINIKALFEIPINVPDSNLESVIRTELNKSSGAIYPSDFSNLKELAINYTKIEDIAPLAKADLSNLEVLDLSSNKIADINPLTETDLSNLNVLDLSSNSLDIKQLPEVLNDLKNLVKLELNNNSLTDLTPLIEADLSNLNDLGLKNNNITDITPFQEAELSNLEALYLDHNGDLEYQWVIDELKSDGIAVSTTGCTVIDDQLDDLLMTVNRQTSFTAAGTYDADDYPYGVIMQVHGSGERYTIYLAKAQGGINHLNHELDEINSRYECIAIAD